MASAILSTALVVNLQVGQELHLLAPLIESLLAHGGQQATHSRRECGVLDIQFDIDGGTCLHGSADTDSRDAKSCQDRRP